MYYKTQITIEKVTFSYDSVKALRNISFEVKKGEFIGLLGPNGSGKTTLLRCLSKVLKPKNGVILIEGENIRNITLKKLAKIVAAVTSKSPDQFNLTVTDIVLMGRHPYSEGLKWWETPEDLDVVTQTMKLLNITGLSNRKLPELSDGEKQRVFIAKALTQEPKVLLIDEPTNHLDIKHQIKTLKLLRKLTSEGITVIAAMHDLNLAAWYCDKIILLNKGKITAIGPPVEVLKPEIIEKVYGVKAIVKHEATKRIVIIPL